MILYALQGPAVEVENRNTWHAIQSRILDNDACEIRREENGAHASLQVVDYRRTPPKLREVFDSVLDPHSSFEDRFVVPELVSELSSKHVITMTYLPGMKPDTKK